MKLGMHCSQGVEGESNLRLYDGDVMGIASFMLFYVIVCSRVTSVLHHQ